jgi:hypothetical protein
MRSDDAYHYLTPLDHDGYNPADRLRRVLGRRLCKQREEGVRRIAIFGRTIFSMIWRRTSSELKRWECRSILTTEVNSAMALLTSYG